MKKLYYGIAAIFIFSSISFAVTPTRYPNGLSTMTSAQESTNGVTPAAGDVNIQGKLNVIGVATLTGQPVFNGGLDVNGSVDIDLDTRAKNFNITTSSQGLIMATIYNSSADLLETTSLLSLDYKDNGDADGIFFQCRDNTYANTVFKIGADGSTTIDASGAGSGTVLSEATLVANDAAFRIDSETQNLQIGDGTNDITITDNGVATFAGTSYIDSETNDLEIGDATNNTVFANDGAITQTGDATLTLQDGSDLIITANANAAPFLSASSADTATNALTLSGGVLISTITQESVSGIRIYALNGVKISTATDVNTVTIAPAGAITTLGAITAGGNVTAVGSVIIGSADMAEADLEKLDGITDGTAAANKALVLDSGSDITTGIDSFSAVTLTATGGKVGKTDSQGNLNYDFLVTTTIIVNVAFPLTPADGKAGSFIVQMGTHTATGTFTSAAVVSLGLATADSAGSDAGTGIAVYDGGAAIVYIKNKSQATQTATIRYSYVN